MNAVKLRRIRAGIVIQQEPPSPAEKHSFGHNSKALLTSHATSETESAAPLPQWEQGRPSMPEGFKRFVARQDTDSLFTSSRKETMTKRVRATSILEDPGARIFLRRAKDAHVEGYASKLLTGATAGPNDSSIDRLEDAGLVEREVQVSCRKTGHALFRLPTPHALAVVMSAMQHFSDCVAPRLPTRR